MHSYNFIIRVKLTQQIKSILIGQVISTYPLIKYLGRQTHTQTLGVPKSLDRKISGLKRLTKKLTRIGNPWQQWSHTRLKTRTSDQWLQPNLNSDSLVLCNFLSNLFRISNFENLTILSKVSITFGCLIPLKLNSPTEIQKSPKRVGNGYMC